MYEAASIADSCWTARRHATMHDERVRHQIDGSRQQMIDSGVRNYSICALRHVRRNISVRSIKQTSTISRNLFDSGRSAKLQRAARGAVNKLASAVVM